MAGKEGGPTTLTTTSNKTPPVATNWVLTVLAPKNLPVRLLREMRTLAVALDQIAAGKSHWAADTIARLKALELSQSDASWSRAQFIELLEPEGPTLLERSEAVLASKEWKLQGGGKGLGKSDQKGETKGGKDHAARRAAKGRRRPQRSDGAPGEGGGSRLRGRRIGPIYSRASP